MAKSEFEILVDEHYEKLYRFAYSLGGDRDLACDLTQQTFCIYAQKGGQIRDRRKTKSWLFTTLHREFIALKRRSARHPEFELEMVANELPPIEPGMIAHLDAQTLMTMVRSLDERFRDVIMLYHLDDLSYKEIAGILGIPIGTVMSRLARGREHLANRLQEAPSAASKVVKMPSTQSA